MKRYLLFMWITYDADCGWEAFKGDFNTLEDAQVCIGEFKKDNDFEWVKDNIEWHIVDCNTKQIIKTECDE